MLIAVRTRGRLAARPDKSAEQPVRKSGRDYYCSKLKGGGAAISHPLSFERPGYCPRGLKYSGTGHSESNEWKKGTEIIFRISH